VRRGEARLNWAIWAGQKGDANALYEAAVSDLTAAIQRNPGRADAWQFRGRARSNWAMHRIIWRNDPGDLWDRSFEDLEKAVSIDGKDVAILWAAASARYMRAETLAMEGKPAAEHYRKALGHFDAMIALDTSNRARVADFAAKARAYLDTHEQE
jgi:tetratricopeptide (TPR) repeat protein